MSRVKRLAFLCLVVSGILWSRVPAQAGMNQICLSENGGPPSCNQIETICEGYIWVAGGGYFGGYCYEQDHGDGEMDLCGDCYTTN